MENVKDQVWDQILSYVVLQEGRQMVRELRHHTGRHIMVPMENKTSNQIKDHILVRVVEKLNYEQNK